MCRHGHHHGGIDIDLRHRSDRMAELSQGATESFSEMYPELLNDLQDKVLQYVAQLRNPGAATTSLIPPSMPPSLAKEIRTEEGFPLMPEINANNKVKKEDLEELIRRYLSAHYSTSQCLSISRRH